MKLRHSLTVVATLFAQPWPALAAAMLVVGTVTAWLSSVPMADAIFIAQLTALMVPLTRLEMRQDLHRQFTKGMLTAR
jgi:hypothetical protein